MTKEERKLALYCLKANSDFHKEVCEECSQYPECDHFIQDGVMEKLIEELEQEPCEDVISREAVEDKLLRLCNELEGIFSDIREKNVDDSVCGLCEYDCDHGLDGYANECPGFETDECFKLADQIRHEWQSTKDIPSVQPKIKVGHWIDIMVGDMQAQACDQCKTFYPLAYTGGGHRFCPNCGAKMESGES